MNDCIKSEMEYREWAECPQWYCVKTVFGFDGTLENEIIKDKMGIPMVVQDVKKPEDSVFDTPEGTVYYTYHRGYKAAALYIESATIGKCS